MATFERRLRVSKTDAFVLSVTEWANGEAITVFTVTDETGLTTVGTTQIDGYNLEVLLTGVSVGNAEIHFQFSTATRSNCDKVTLKVINDC